MNGREKNSKRVIAKPTTPFGGIVFEKDGSVRPCFEMLPDNTKGQEEEVALRFVAHLHEELPDDVRVRMLPHDDQDFLIAPVVSGAPIATIQATEIVLQNYCTRLSREEYLKGRFSNVIMAGHDVWYAVDDDLLRDIVRMRVEQKIRKHYSKPIVGEFWLLVWSVTGHPIGDYYQSGNRQQSEALCVAREWVSVQNALVFDRIYYFDLNVRPERIL
jgi:hypothetical protein